MAAQIAPLFFILFWKFLQRNKTPAQLRAHERWLKKTHAQGAHAFLPPKTVLIIFDITVYFFMYSDVVEFK